MRYAHLHRSASPSPPTGPGWRCTAGALTRTCPGSRGTALAWPTAAFAQANAAYPFGFDRKLQWTWRSRYFRVAEGSLAAMASAHDVRVLNPFASEGVMAALARRGGMPGLGGRDDLVHLLFAGALPPAVLRRTSKASFTEQVWSAAASTFARDWSGGGTNEDLVDPGRLRQHWLGAERSVLSTTLLQAAWLHDHGGSSTKGTKRPENTKRHLL